MKFKYIFLAFSVGFLFLKVQSVKAQYERPVIQFSGIIIGQDERPISGVNVYIPKAGRGSVTNNVGFFALPTLPGDSVVVSAVGFKKRYISIPNNLTERAYSVLIELKEDVTMLPTVEIYPYPTEELFKQAFMAMQLPDEREQAAVRKNLDQDLLTRMMYESTTLDPQASYRYYMNQQSYATANRNFYQANPLLNPLAWYNFIKSVKRGDLKKKKWKEDN